MIIFLSILAAWFSAAIITPIYRKKHNIQYLNRWEETINWYNAAKETKFYWGFWPYVVCFLGCIYEIINKYLK